MKSHFLSVGILVFLVAFCFAGCTTMNVSMNPKFPGDELAGKRIPVRVGLYMDNEFVNYHWHGQSNAEMSKLDYDFGSASKALFLETFMRVSKGTLIVDKKPPYAPQDQIDVSIVIEPHITSFNEDHSALVRIADYTAHIEYKVTVYDKEGKILLDKTYKADGVAKGHATVSPSSNYAAPAEIAMEKVAVMIVDDLINIKMAAASL
jgi:hypothetical protein